MTANISDIKQVTVYCSNDNKIKELLQIDNEILLNWSRI